MHMRSRGRVRGAASSASAIRSTTGWRQGRQSRGHPERRGARDEALPRRESAGRHATRARAFAGTAREVKAIAELFGSDAKLYLRDQASEENVKAGVLEPGRGSSHRESGLFETDYQALALSMRPDGADDGFLLQSEIAELKLDADLVVLSACETGRAHGCSQSRCRASCWRAHCGCGPDAREPVARR